MKNANPVSLTLRTLLVLCWGLIAAGCGGGDEPAATPKPAEHYFPIEVGGRTVELQLAIAPAELERGLMFRRDLKSNQGMLFLFSQPQQMGFWMRNTPTPLDIGFFTSDGVLREIYPLHPFDERSVRSKREDLQYAVEVCQGWFDATGVKPGDKIDLKAVAAAVKARGYSVKGYKGLN